MTGAESPVSEKQLLKNKDKIRKKILATKCFFSESRHSKICITTIPFLKTELQDKISRKVN
ncbi:hypothetical protein LEP1GSC084_1523 [Leptospira interrogans serovar Medanensis str. L0448]|nr:hypothetical protein LEP1GSC084_1523 [Leptospira interrogans serovar Medanensis str. L0448]EMN39567.1 hypothetical protein LEP1GSC085_0634 [Leptospira interrogans str. L0996]EMN95087.1 hypothetical protein LEP1GSC110_3066 [Leptospira interrogans serovar Medanensis str. UT053]